MRRGRNPFDRRIKKAVQAAQQEVEQAQTETVEGQAPETANETPTPNTYEDDAAAG